MMSQMTSGLNKQIADLEKKIADAKKNKEDPDKIKQMEDGLASLKKQVAQISGVNQNFSNTSDQSFQQATKSNNQSLPKKDLKRIGNLPKQIFSDQELGGFVKTVFTKIEKKLPADELSAAKEIFDEIKANYLKDKPKYKMSNAISNAATGCWIYGHWEKTIWLAGKACIDDVTDLYKINNYASYLSMLGCEDAAIPILEWLNQKRPKSAPILNNLGQAWFGLGEIPKAKQYLENAVNIDEYHSLANLTLSKIYKSEGDYMRAVGAMKASIKKCWTPEKEAELEKLGEKLEDEDIDFDYPMDDDPLGYEPFLHAFPTFPDNVSETAKSNAEWDAYYEAVQRLEQDIRVKSTEAAPGVEKFSKKAGDWDFNQPLMEMHRTNAWAKATRKFQFAATKTSKSALSMESVMNLMANAYHEATTERLNALEKERRNAIHVGMSCSELDAVNNSFMAAAKAVMADGERAWYQVYRENKAKVDQYIKLTAYASLNDYSERMSKFAQDVWQKNQWIYVYQAHFGTVYQSLKSRPLMYSECNGKEAPKQTWQLPSFKTPKCAYSTSINLYVGSIKEQCNTIKVEESKLKYKKNNSQKGEIKLEMQKTLDEIQEIITDVTSPGVELEIGEITEIAESEPSSGRKLELEMGEIRMPTQSNLTIEILESGITIAPATSSSTSASLQFDAGGNVMINTSRMRTFF